MSIDGDRELTSIPAATIRLNACLISRYELLDKSILKSGIFDDTTNTSEDKNWLHAVWSYVPRSF